MDPIHPRVEPSFVRDPAAPAQAAPAAAPTQDADAGSHPTAEGADAPGAGEEAAGGFSGVSLTAMHWGALAAPAPQAEHVARNPSLPTFVGLIMLILTFFIVLSSI
ncbi:MAG TPA: hypothetical protein PLR41_00585, partial [Alphaproteobacteria bacterium]|nr:hypothetical protein [Alphaproteobacteria bacterium]